MISFEFDPSEVFLKVILFFYSVSLKLTNWILFLERSGDFSLETMKKSERNRSTAFVFFLSVRFTFDSVITDKATAILITVSETRR